MAMSRAAQIIVGSLAIAALAACEPKPPKPKTEVERQASAQTHASTPRLPLPSVRRWSKHVDKSG
jgi:hypothetical protein